MLIMMKQALTDTHLKREIITKYTSLPATTTKKNSDIRLSVTRFRVKIIPLSKAYLNQILELPICLKLPIFPGCLQQSLPEYNFPQNDFIIFRNFNIYVSSAANLVRVERVLSEKLRIWLCLFFLLVKMADRGHSKTSILFLIIKPKIF